jgi:spermidine synthase
MFRRALAEGSRERQAVLAAVAALGFSCVVTQLALMRECLAAFAGNEMVLGVVLGLWLLLMGLGAWLGRMTSGSPRSLAYLSVALHWIALLPLLQVFALRTLRDVIFTRGAAVGLNETVAGVGALLMPYCLVAGWTLTLACAILGRWEGPSGIGRAYFADTLGSIAGGALFSFILVRVLDHLAMLAVPALLCLLSAAALSHVRGKSGLSLVSLGLGVGLCVAAVSGDPDGLATRLQYRHHHVLARANSPYGRLVVLKTDGTLDFLENGVPLVTTRDDQHVEETVHYALAQRPEADRVLLISGGISGTAREILKYNVRQVDYVELDPLILELGRKYLPENFSDPRIRIHARDGRLLVRQITEPYDVILLDVPAPASAQLNRFFTAEFLAEARRALTPDGVLSFSLGRYENFVSPDLARVLACAWLSLEGSFSNRLMLPGGRVFFLASNGPLHTNIAERLEQGSIATRLVNRHYLEAMLTPDRLADLERALAHPSAVNRDFNPVLYYYHLRHWLSQFDHRLGPVPIASLAVLAFYLLRLRGSSAVLFASGFAASALEFVLLLAFQILCGSVYHQVGVIVTVFMLGLALGAWWANRRLGAGGAFKDRRALRRSAMALGLYALLLPLVLPRLAPAAAAGPPLPVIQIVIALLTLVLAMAVGLQLPLAGRIESGSTAGVAARLYTADFMGAFLGALLASTWLIPLLGVSGVCWLCAGLNLAGAAVFHFRKAVS